MLFLSPIPVVSRLIIVDALCIMSTLGNVETMTLELKKRQAVSDFSYKLVIISSCLPIPICVCLNFPQNDAKSTSTHDVCVCVVFLVTRCPFRGLFIILWLCVTCIVFVHFSGRHLSQNRWDMCWCMWLTFAICQANRFAICWLQGRLREETPPLRTTSYKRRQRRIYHHQPPIYLSPYFGIGLAVGGFMEEHQRASSFNSGYVHKSVEMLITTKLVFF